MKFMQGVEELLSQKELLIISMANPGIRERFLRKSSMQSRIRFSMNMKART